MSALSSSDKRVSRVSFVGDLSDFPERLSRLDLQARTSVVYDWTATAVEKVYKNNVYEVALYLLGATIVLVLLMTFVLPTPLEIFRHDMILKLACRATLVLSFVTLLCLRSYFSFTVDLVALGIVVLVTSLEMSRLEGTPLTWSLALLFTSILVLAMNHLALIMRPNLAVLAILVLLNTLLVINLNFITLTLGKSTLSVNLTIFSCSILLSVLAIMGFSIVIGDDHECPIEVTDKISSGTILYFLVLFLCSNLLMMLNLDYSKQY